ncbi:hypothetical protein GCM10009836_40600 [Pseudonocardia ailaonensis]|uniref:Uncharacterized protein n=1 Tax=Pseudonocardia ailaonensis TaxID=367279 RepID=A0ABN2N7E7_9PSEU
MVPVAASVAVPAGEPEASAAGGTVDGTSAGVGSAVVTGSLSRQAGGTTSLTVEQVFDRAGTGSPVSTIYISR